MKTWAKIFSTLVYIFLYAPILVLIIFSFNESKSTTRFTGFTFHWYSDLFSPGNELLSLLLNTLIIAVLSSLIATVLGTAAAIGIHSMKKRIRSLVLTISNIPMTNPEIVTGVSLALLFAFIGTILKVSDILGFWTLLIAHITFNLPYVILSVMPKLRQIDPHLGEAAMDLGCKPAQSFFKVVLPQIMPGVFSGLIMAFTLSLDDFIISYFAFGPSFVTLPLAIYNYTKKPMPPSVYSLFTIMFFVILLMMVVMNLIQARDEKKIRQRNAIR